MATFELLTLDELHDLLVAAFQNRFPNHNVSRLSDNWKRLRVLAMAVTDMQANTEQKARDLQPGVAKGTALDILLSMFGLARTAATPARGTDVGRVKGVSGSAYDITDRLEHANGLTYRPNESGTVPAAGFVDIDIIAVDTGSETKLDSGEVLVWTTTPTGLENEVELQGDLDQGGEDEESDGSAQKRLLDRIAQGAAGGNVNDYVTWILEATDSNEDDLNFKFAYVWPNRAGKGSVDVAALFDGEGSARLPSAAQRTALSDYIEPLRPANMDAVRVLEVTEESTDLEMTIEPRPGQDYAKDWDDSDGFTVASWTASTRTLQLSANRPPDLDVGSRMIVAGHTGDQLVVEKLGSNPDEVIIRATTEEGEDIYTPVATETVYAGGPLVEPVRDAIRDLVKLLGPYHGDYGSGEWISTWYVHQLEAAADAVTGVLKPSMVTPSSDQDATASPFPNDTTVNLLTLGETLVRYA